MVVLSLALAASLLGGTRAFALNAIVLENQQPGSPASEWDVSGIGDPTIQGFATDISVNRGDTVHFKIKTPSTAYHIEIYRLGYYGGDGARHVDSGVVTAALPQAQPADLFDPVTGTTDCGNWAESAHWDVPSTAVSGVYIARLIRDDVAGASHIVFIVRDDASTSDLFFQTSDATWQAYNGYGGNSLYVGGSTTPPGLNHAAKVSYNRPFYTRGGGGGSGSSEDWLFNAEYPMIRWLEANGYDVSYTTDVDSDRRGNLILQHKVFLSVGHDEYWSAAHRANVQAARDAGVHLAFFSGNEIYWKTRFEPSTDGTNTPYRTLVCYKEGTLGENICGGKCDPLAGVWTGLWRDGCPPTYAANDGCRPENALSGQISWQGSTTAIQVPDTYKNLRFWRNTSIPSLGSGQTATLGPSTLGYEWDWEQYGAYYPARRILLSSTTSSGRTHHLSLYRADSGALVFGAGTVQWSWGLDSNHDGGNDPADPRMQQATVNLFADMGVAPGSLQPGLVEATASSDATAPTSAIGFPLDGATLPSGTTVTVTGTATDAGGGVVAGVEVSTDGGTTWSPANGTTAWSFAWTPGAQGAATIRSRAYDDTGNLESPGASIAVTIGPPAPPSCPCTVFSPAATPAVITENDTNDGELGMKFRSSVDGFVTGVRFYKSPSNTGVHTGHLWTTGGIQLAEVTFTGESASGWQEATFTSPVAITAGTTYIVSYHCEGFYSVDSPGGFATAVSNGPLRALADGEDGPNGVYAYGITPAFPNQTFSASNYWVDVVFNTAVGPDETPPTVVALSPGNGTLDVATGAGVSATFSEAIDGTTVSGATFELRDPSSALVPAGVTYNSLTRVATLTPSSPLANSTTYTATVRGGATDPRIKDLAGNALAANVGWSFTTAAPPPPPPTEGPGGPILVISAAANPFSRYYAEILRTEGLNAFTAMDVSLVDAGVLANYDVVILGEMPLTADQVTMLSDWTSAGGTLIAMRPDKQLAGLLGLTDANATVHDQYLLVNTASGPGVGIVGQTMQYHGTADLYTLNGATSLATLYSTASTALPNPAATTRSVGVAGGRAIAFTYDLARSVIYTRQGNPAWVNQKRDGQIDPIRSDDQFFGGTDPDWIDFNKVAIPQADEQQRLLANAILQGNLHKKPLPRFWYLPKGLKAAIVETGDNHSDTGMAPRFEIYRNESAPGCSVQDWDCVRATGYLYVGSTFTDAQALMYHNLGFEVALHVNTNCQNFTQSQYQSFITTQMSAFQARFPSIPLPKTNRNHCIAWSDWSMTAETEVQNGIRFDTNYYYWPASWIQNRPGMFGGSGMCMRFAKLDGTMVDCYQAVTEMPDESGESFPSFCDALLDKAIGPEGYYGIFTTNMHFDTANHPGSNAIVASAQARGVPVVSAKQMLDWLDGRNNSSFDNIAWSGNQLSFGITAASGSRNMRAMLPMLAAVGTLTGITRDGNPVAFTTQTVKGMDYAFFPADGGNYVAQYAIDTTPPAISAVSATPHTDGSATVTWTTTENSDSRVDYGTSAGSLTLNVSSSTPVTAHSLTLTGLSPLTTYWFRVTSVDGASNSATEPAEPAPPMSFTMPAAVCASDVVAADFAGGTTGANTLVVSNADGEVILKPALDAEFDGAALPAGWSTGNGSPWTGGAVTVGGGKATASGAHAFSAASFTSGTSMEFVATFRADPYQNVGFSTGGNFDAPWVTIGSSASGNGVYARMSPSTDISLGAGLLGSPHRYRIDWTGTGFAFYVDGAATPAATIATPVGTGMVAQISDLTANANDLDVDWIRISPYAASGSFTSRVFDGGGPANWDVASWSADAPTGTSLAMLFRSGDTPTPDGTWGAFTAVGNGSSIGTLSRYLQYRADLATTVSSATPALKDVVVTCTTGPDVVPPAISAVAATPSANGQSASIGWSTNEPSTSRVDYGTDAGTLSLNVVSGALVSSHGLGLTGLAPGVTYYYRVTSVDAANNSATYPAEPGAPLSFTTPTPPCAQDALAADFAAGTTGAGTYVSETADGEVILAPAEGAEFSGAALPAGWTSATYSGGGTVVVSGGRLAVDGAYAATVNTYGPGHSVEFVATFDASANGQHCGFGTDVNAAPWAIFSTMGGGALYARTNDGAETNDLIPGSWLGSPHRFRIDWGASSITYSIDGAVVMTHNIPVAGPMRPIASRGPATSVPLLVDWMRMSPYPAAGTFASRVFDAGASSHWGVATWTSSAPAGTSVAVSARLGNTPTPDATWTNYLPLAGSGAAVPGTSRYLQYRADLTSSQATVTPELRDLAIQCTPGADTSPPSISAVVATPAGNGQSALVTWSTDEAATSLVAYGTSPGSLSQSASVSGLDVTHSVTLPSLTPGTLYYYRVTAADLAGNAATSPNPPAAPATFTTPAPACFVDATSTDFSAGTPGANTYVSKTADGEVTLAPTVGAEFEGASLPPGWVLLQWTPPNGTATVAGGSVTVDGTRINPSPTTYGPGAVLEFVATFAASSPYQHVGFGGGSDANTGGIFNNPQWAMFSTGSSGAALQARTWDGGAFIDHTLAGSYLGSSHRYRIEWLASVVNFYVDGALVDAITTTLAGPMRPAIGDLNVGGGTLVVDWLRTSPYATSGTYLSRVYTSGTYSAWGQAVWSSTTPSGTGVAMSVRTGNTPTPDGTWSAFAALPSSGSSVGASSYYVQYRADLSTADATVTPALNDMTIQCVAVPDNVPPVISNVQATTGAGGQTATVTWTTDEAATSRVDYGTSPASLTLNASSATLVGAHSLGLSGLTPLTTYYYRVTSVDAASNAATSPDPPAAPLSFTTGAPSCPSDVTLADFSAGTFDANTTTAQAGDGEVILKPASIAEFDGAALPATWQSAAWSPGSVPTVGGGQITLSGGHAATNATFGPGTSIEFVATFRAEPNQHVGFTADFPFNAPWALFSTFNTTNSIYARVNSPGGTTDNLVSTGLIGSPHRYRIDWKAASFDFYVDGALVSSITRTISSNMLVHASDLASAGPLTLSLDWMRVSPYPAAGSFTSRVFDGAGPTNWGVATWTAETPAGTSLAINVRSGNTPAPDGTWSAFGPVLNGGSVGENARYVQYRADLATTVGVSPSLDDLAIACSPGGDTTPPVISNVAASPAANGISATVTWTTNEDADSRVDYGTSAGSLGFSASSPPRVKSHSVPLTGLTPNTTYYYRVTSADAALNSVTSPNPPAAPLTFVTPILTCFTDQAAADFAGGTNSNTYVSTQGDGEVVLASALENDFPGAALPSGWTSVAWGAGGTSTVGSGKATVDGARLTTPIATGYTAGKALEFSANFGGASFQNIGWGAGDDGTSSTGMFATGAQPWAMFGTAGTTNTIFARLNPGGDVSIGTGYTGAFHRYRIEWKSSPDSIIFLIDGAIVNRRPFSPGTTMRPGISDFATGGANVQVDWLRVLPYVSPGTFVSRVYDAGGPTSWLTATWTATLPALTGLAISARTGNTPAPDGTWSAYVPVASPGGAVGLCGRYVQYQAVLTSSDPNATPVLDQVAFTCAPASGPAAAVTNLAAAFGTGNDTSGRYKVALTWSGAASGTTIQVWRKGFGDYPLYRTGVGAVPAAPANPTAAQTAGWTQTGVTASGQTDQPPTRDYWYYVLYQLDGCGNSSPASNRVETPGYLLGDVSDGVTACAGNNLVNTADLTFLGAHYGASIVGPSDPIACLDVAPTTNASTHGRPTPDAVVDFEDLVIYALNYSSSVNPAMVAGTAGFSAGAPSDATLAAAPANGLRVRVPALPGVGETFDVALDADGAGDAHALSIELGFDPAIVEQVSAAPGTLLGQQAAQSYLLSPRPGRVDVALLGARSALTGSGELARVRFRVKAAGDPAIVLKGVDARDGRNQNLSFAPGQGEVAQDLPARTELGAIYPNPFRHDLSVEFSLRQATRARLNVYDVAGRLVRTLLDGVQPAGRRTVVWDGRGRSGIQLASGYYILRFQAGDLVQTHPVWLVR